MATADRFAAALLALARAAIEEDLGMGRDIVPDAPGLDERRAVFVTLRRGGELRGCIGTTDARQPLREVVPEVARAAAFQDPRFEPLAAHELADLEVEVSVLTPPEPLDDLARVEVGRHGLVVSAGRLRGLLLASVAVDHHLTREEFLSLTCRKAGLPDDAWRTRTDLRWWTFETEVHRT